MELELFGGAVSRDSGVAMLAVQTMWFAVEGAARADFPAVGVNRTSLGLTNRLAVGTNPLTDAVLVEVGLGLAAAHDYQYQDGTFAAPTRGGAFAALSVTAVATHARLRGGDGATWLGVQFGLEFDKVPGSPGGGARVVRARRYDTARPGEPTDCDSGHMP